MPVIIPHAAKVATAELIDSDMKAVFSVDNEQKTYSARVRKIFQCSRLLGMITWSVVITEILLHRNTAEYSIPKDHE